MNVSTVVFANVELEFLASLSRTTSRWYQATTKKIKDTLCQPVVQSYGI